MSPVPNELIRYDKKCRERLSKQYKKFVELFLEQLVLWYGCTILRSYSVD